MKTKTIFYVNALVKVYSKDPEDNDFKPYNKILELSLDKESAEKFLFRFYNPIFNIGDYKFIFNYDNIHEFKYLSIVNTNKEEQENCFYVVTNMNQLVSDILEGYMQICSMEKVANIVEFDFECALEDISTIEEEM